MPSGTCRLCFAPDVVLRDSHFVPRAYYKRFRERTLAHTEPVLASQEKSLLSGEQAHDYLLCEECEARFSRNGEKWVLENCWREPDDFPLRTRLIAAGPSSLSSGDLTIFETVTMPGVDRDKLVYFSASVFWRAAVHDWHLPSGCPLRLSLGPYEDEFRRYLLGEREFPRNAVMLVTISRSMDEMNNKYVTFPWLYKHDGRARQFKMIVPGIAFHLFVGRALPPTVRSMCAARSEQGFIYMSQRADKMNMHDNLALLKRARRVGKLATKRGVILSDSTGTT